MLISYRFVHAPVAEQTSKPKLWLFCTIGRFVKSEMAAAAGDDTAAMSAVQQCWSSTFPEDLLAVVYHMVASPRGRVRFAAVRRSWRAAAQHRAPPCSGCSSRPSNAA